MPAGFGLVGAASGKARAGYWSGTNSASVRQFPGVLDEIRFSLGALPASRIWTEFSGMP